MNVRNLERLGEKKFKSFESADSFRKSLTSPTDKIKVFARNDNTYDVVWYKKIGSPVEEQVVEKVAVPEKIHGLKSKERKKPFIAKKFA